jgi:hypothetical protein
MNAASTERLRTREEYLELSEEQRHLVSQLYQSRLTRLLETEPTEPSDDDDLTKVEQERLRSRAVLNAVRTLTALGEGATASTLLRQASRR